MIVAALLALQACAGAAAHAAEVSSQRLIENAKFYDGKIITFTGEAVTAVMKRGAHAWLAVNDGRNTIGVWCKTSFLGPVAFLGNYKTKGDTVEVVGIFNRACAEHGGDLDIHADSVTVLKQGRDVAETVSGKKTRIAFILFFVTIAIVLLFRKRL